MDAFMNADIALGEFKASGFDFTAAERVRVIRRLTERCMICHLRGFEPMGDILQARSSPLVYVRRMVPDSVKWADKQLKDYECMELYRQFVWNDELASKRHDIMLYLSKRGNLVLWEGNCTTPRNTNSHTEVYWNLSITIPNDNELGTLLEGRVFEDVIEKLRLLQCDSLRAAEQAIRELRDNMRTTSQTQKRLGFYPQR